MSEPIRLNLGAGARPIPGFIDVDRKDGGEVFPLLIPQQGGDRLPDDSVDEIYASHILEHFSHGQTLEVLKEWVRVLKPGSRIRIAVPDFDKIVSFYNEGTDDKVESYLMGGHQDDNDHHGAIFNEQKLRGLMRHAGLVGVRPFSGEYGDCACNPVSLNLMGFKPTPEMATVKGVHAVMSVPRLCFADQVACVIATVDKLKIPTRLRQGVFWGQTLTAAIEQAIQDGAEYILTIDYDSVFTPDDVRELYRLMQTNPEADAIFAMQVGRDRDSILLTIRKSATKNASGIERQKMAADLLPASTGHFGLTLIRVSSLQKMPKPWFLHHPDPQNGWGDGRVDEDIHFWRQAECSGWKVFQANRVVIGHGQFLISWPDQNLQPVHQYAGDYRMSGAPESTWK
jgi:predicted SAM-dependent methyltransferase